MDPARADALAARNWQRRRERQARQCARGLDPCGEEWCAECGGHFDSDADSNADNDGGESDARDCE